MLNRTTCDDLTLGEALNASAEERDAWLRAFDEEMQSSEENHSWKVDENPKRVALLLHIVLSIKRDVDGNVDRFKACLVAGRNL